MGSTGPVCLLSPDPAPKGLDLPEGPQVTLVTLKPTTTPQTPVDKEMRLSVNSAKNNFVAKTGYTVQLQGPEPETSQEVWPLPARGLFWEPVTRQLR